MIFESKKFDFELFELLLSFKPELNYINGGETWVFTPLILNALSLHLDDEISVKIAKLMIKNGAKLDIKFKKPLYTGYLEAAYFADKFELFKLFLNNNAPADESAKSITMDMLIYLSKSGAKITKYNPDPNFKYKYIQGFP